MKTCSFIFLFIFLMGCSENQSVNLSDDIDFGASYSIISTSEAPTIQNGTLIATVGYSGCNSGHEFELEHQITDTTAKLWLFKKTEDQLCEAYFEEEKSYDLPESVLNSEKIFLITPKEKKISLK